MKKDYGFSVFMAARNTFGTFVPKLKKVENVHPEDSGEGPIILNGVLRYICEWAFFAFELRVFFKVPSKGPVFRVQEGGKA